MGSGPEPAGHPGMTNGLESAKTAFFHRLESGKLGGRVPEMTSQDASFLERRRD
jgi:hypothetical protein